MAVSVEQKLEGNRADKVRSQVSVPRQLACLDPISHHLRGVLAVKVPPPCKWEVVNDINKPGTLPDADTAE